MSETPAENVQAPEQPKDLLKDTPIAGDKKLGEAPRADLQAFLLRAAEREGATTPEAFDQLVGRMKTRIAALVQAIDPADSPAMHALGHMYDKEFATHTTQPGQEHEVAMWAARSVLLNRRDDLVASLKALEDESFLLPLRTEAIQPGFKAPELDTALSPEKLEAEKKTLTLTHDGKIDTPIHFMMAATAQHKSHAILMDAFAPGSTVAEALKASMQAILPAEEHQHAEALLGEWMLLRAERAKGIMEADRPDGPLVTESIRAWDAQRLGAVSEVKPTELANDNAAPAPQAAEAPKVGEIPANIVEKPVVEAGKIMDNIEQELAAGAGR